MTPGLRVVEEDPWNENERVDSISEFSILICCRRLAALNQNRPPNPDSTIIVLASSMIELIVDLAGPFCMCSWAVLK